MPKKLPMTDTESEPVQTSIADAVPESEKQIFAIDREALRRSVKSGREYVWPPSASNPRSYTSVTTALNVLPKPFLTRWAAKVVAETAVAKHALLNDLIADDPEDAIKWLKGAPWSSRDRAARMGTEVHLVAELDALGKHTEADEIVNAMKGEAKAKVMHMRDFFASVPMKIISVEGVVYSDKYGFAGTYDFIIELSDPAILGRLPVDSSDSITVLVDLKTGKGVYAETALQLAAYRFAEEMVEFSTGERVPMVNTDAGAVLHVTANGWKFIPATCDKEQFDTFLAALALAKKGDLPRELISGAALAGKWDPQTGPPISLKGLK